MARPTALAMHVFGGGFLVGAERRFKVVADLETFGMFAETVKGNRPRLRHEVDPDGQWDLSEWEGVDVLFGNPRCSAFSVVNTGYEKTNSYGADGKQTIDLRQFWSAAKRLRPKFAVFESVQQCGKIGRPLLEQIYADVGPLGYRFAEVYFDNSHIGVSQKRKRFFGVWYRDDQKFSLGPLPMVSAPPAYQKFADLEKFSARALNKREPLTLEPDSENGLRNHVYYELHSSLSAPGFIASVRQGECVDQLDDARLELAPKLLEKRRAGKGFGRVPAMRMRDDRIGNVIYSRSYELIHPHLDRPITVREAARLMGFPDDYGFVGKDGFTQLGNGVAVPVGEWIAGEIARCLARPKAKDTVIVVDPKTREARFEDATGAPLKQYYLNRGTHGLAARERF